MKRYEIEYIYPYDNNIHHPQKINLVIIVKDDKKLEVEKLTYVTGRGHSMGTNPESIGVFLLGNEIVEEDRETSDLEDISEGLL